MITSAARADRMADILSSAGWTELPGDARRLRVMRLGPADASLKCAYELSPTYFSIPERLVLTHDDERREIDVLGSDDPPFLPATAPLDELLAIIATMPSTPTAADLRRTAHRLGLRAHVPSHPPAGVPFWEGLLKALPWPAWRDLDDVLAELAGDPHDPDALLATGFAAVYAERFHLATTAMARAYDTGRFGGVPLLVEAMLRIHAAPDTARDLLDRALAHGDVTGPAHWLRAVLEGWNNDRPAEFAAWRRGTTEAPEHVRCWAEYGLALSRIGRPAEAIAVLTEALTHHAEDPYLHEYLAYARLKTGDKPGAVAALEASVRVAPERAATIRKDRDFAPLRRRSDFTSLKALGERLSPARDRAVRAALRTAGTRIPAHPDANDLDALRDMYDRLQQRTAPRTLPETDAAEVTDQPLWTILTRIGLPKQIGTLTTILGYGGRLPKSLRPIADAVRPGEAGLLRLGSGTGFRHVGVDPLDGGVFGTDRHGVLHALAPDLASYLLYEFRNERRTLLLSGGDLRALDETAAEAAAHGLGPGVLTVKAKGLDKAGAERLAAFIREHGASLTELHVEQGVGHARADLTDIDFASACPGLEALALHRFEVNGTVFTHPRLSTLVLSESCVRGPRDIALGTAERNAYDGRALTRFKAVDCLVFADSFTVGPASRLHHFDYMLDEDAAERYPERFTFDGCRDLRWIDFAACMPWTLTLSGPLPELHLVRTNPGQYGSVEFEANGAAPGETKRLEELMRDGARAYFD